MRLPTTATNAAFLAGPLLLVLAACTAQGSTTTVQGPGGTSGSPAFPDLGSGTTDGGTTSTGVTDYEALFGPPASTDTTPNTLTGLWAGTAGFGSTDTRMEFTSTSIVIAEKCGAQTVGLMAVAHVTASSIKTLESKNAAPSSTSGTGGTKAAGGSGCSLKVTPLEVVRCTASTESNAQLESDSITGGCFFLSGTKLSFYDSTALAGPAKLTKLSD